jgi:Mor family transcriptional regulator
LKNKTPLPEVRPMCHICGVKPAVLNSHKTAYSRPCWNCRTTSEQKRNHQYRKAYGITLEQRTAMLEKQGGLCIICGELPATDTDHCHATGVVRGIVCHPCNMAIGAVRERPEIALKLSEFLKTHDLRTKTPEEIKALSVAKKRRPKGNPKLTPEQVEAIRKDFASGRNYKDIAADFDIDPSHVYNCLEQRPGTPKGEAHGGAIFTAEDVRDMRSRFARGDRITDIARLYQHDTGYISRIIHRKTWKHID